MLRSPRRESGDRAIAPPKEKRARPPKQPAPEVRALAEAILRRWSGDTSLKPLFNAGLADRAAHLAALEADVAQRAPGEGVLPIIDEVSGLSLPIPLRTPYQQRGQDDDGRRRDVLAHIGHEYADYIKAGLFSTGFLYEHDRAAYNALTYKATRSVAEGRDASVPDFCLRHHILTREHLLHPPKRFVRQIALLRTAQAAQLLAEAKGHAS